MRLRLAGLVLLLSGGLVYFLALLPLRREVSSLQVAYAQARQERESQRTVLAGLQGQRRRVAATDSVSLALTLRPGLVACLESAGVEAVEYAFEGDSVPALDIRLAGLGEPSEVREALDCVASPHSGLLPGRVSVARVASGLRLEISGVPGSVVESTPPSSSGRGGDPFGEQPRAVERIETVPPHPSPQVAPGPLHSLSALESPVRLVGVLEREGRFRAALSIRGEVVLVSPGESASGYVLVRVDPASGAVIEEPTGAQIQLSLPDAD
jgi:hypothetical protein